MRLFREYLRNETARCVANGVRLEVIGRRDRIGPALRRAIEEPSATPRAAHGCCSGSPSTTPRATPSSAPRSAFGPIRVPTREAFARLVAIVDHGSPVPEVDLLIRTGGERRLSDFLLWEAAYAELLFSPLMWPEFGPGGAAGRPCRFPARVRRFGGLPDAAAG